MGRNLSRTNSPFEQARRQNLTEVSARLSERFGGCDSESGGGDHSKGMQFNPSQLAMLSRLLKIPLEYMDSKELHSGDAEHRLFDLAVSVPDPDITWYHPVMTELGLQGDSGRNRNRRRGEVMRLTGKQERALFYQFNYSRLRVRTLQDLLGVEVDLDPKREPTAEEAEGLVYWGSRAKELREQVAETNVGLVLAMVRRTSLKNVDVADLVSEGNMALLRAIDKFNPDFGFKFSTYACQSILKAFSRLAHKESRLRERFPMEFDPEMEQSGWSGTVRETFEEDCAAEVADIVRSNRCHLSEVELRVVRHRFGLDSLDGQERMREVEDRPISGGKRLPKRAAASRRMTLGEVGQMIGVGKERVRQIQVKALLKIRTELETGFLTGRTAQQVQLEEYLSECN